MNDAVREAICRIDVGESRGTGTLVGEGLVLTAMHVVANRRADTFEPYRGTITLTFPSHKTDAKIVDKGWDGQSDWIVLKCDTPPKEVTPVSLGDFKRGQAEWETYGFPDANPTDGMKQSGSVEMARSRLQGVTAMQLFSKQAASGDGAPVKGLSGAPVIIQDRVVGVMRFALMKEGKTVAGTLYACPAVAATAGCPDLPRPVRLRTAQERKQRSIVVGAALAVAVGAGFGGRAFVQTLAPPVLAIQEFLNDTHFLATGIYNDLGEVGESQIQALVPQSSRDNPPRRYQLAGSVSDRMVTAQLLVKGNPGPRLGGLDLDALQMAGVQDSIAVWVASELGIDMSEDTHDDIFEHGTDDPEAYLLVRRGETHLMGQMRAGSDSTSVGGGLEVNVEAATSLFWEAVREDRAYSAAWARLSESYSMRAFWSDTLAHVKDEWADSALYALERAEFLENDDGDGEVDRARGVYLYRIEHQYTRAETALRESLEERPGDSDTNFLMGLVLRRQRKWQEALDFLIRASESQPNAWDKAYVTGETYTLIDDYDNAAEHYDHALAAVSGPGPEDDVLHARTMLARGSINAFQSGDIAELGDIARAAVEDSTNAQSVMAAILRPDLRYLARMLRPDALQALLDVPLDAVPRDPIFYHMTRADIYRHNGNTAQARVEARLAADSLDAWASLKGDTTIAEYHIERALSHAILGEEEAAIAEAENALRAVASAHYVGSGTMAKAVTHWWATEVYLIVGRSVEAANLVSTQLNDPGYILTEEWVCIDPLYAPIREGCAPGG